MPAALPTDTPQWRLNGIGSGIPGPGRDTLYTPQLGVEVCRLISVGETLRSIAKMPGMPAPQTVWRWREEHPVFGMEYARARELSAEFLENEALDRLREAEDGEKSQVAWRFLDGVKWAISKRNPREYGEKVTHEFSGTLTVEHELCDRAQLMLELQRRLGIEAGVPATIEGMAEPPSDSESTT